MLEQPYAEMTGFEIENVKLPKLQKFSNSTILQKKNTILQRQVINWEHVEPESQKRKRIIKQYK